MEKLENLPLKVAAVKKNLVWKFILNLNLTNISKQFAIRSKKLRAHARVTF